MASLAAIRPGAGKHADRRWLLSLGGLVLLLIVVIGVLAPAAASNDPRPSTYNTAPRGTKAAYLMLGSLGRPVARWEQPLTELGQVDAAHTTLVLPAPLYSALEKDWLAGALRGFLERGGRLVTTGAEGALLIPGGGAQGGRRLGALCYTRPEGPGTLAQAGEVEIEDTVRWADENASVRVEERCGPDAVVVRVPVGRGEAIWWSAPGPMTNAELKNDGDLKLLLASLGAGRRVLFDESLLEPVRSKWSAAAGLPLRALLLQAALVFGFLVFSFSRRRGPVRLPVAVPRSSPVEFAVSMGDLYERAGATDAAIDAAQRRLRRTLMRDGGLAQRTVEEGPEAVVTALAARFGGEWTAVGEHLREAASAAGTQPRVRGALALVQAMGADAERVRHTARPGKGQNPQPNGKGVSSFIEG